MTVYNLSTALVAIQIIQAGEGPCLVINRDHTNTVLLGLTSSVGTSQNNNVTKLDPLSTISFDGNVDVYATAATGTAEINVQADASHWSPSTTELVEPLVLNTGVPLTSGGTVNIAAVDVRGFTGYYMRIAPSVSGAPIIQNALTVVSTWYSDINGTFALFVEAWQFWVPQGAGGTGVAFDTSSLRAQDSMHGPAMGIQLFSPGGNNLNVDVILFGTTRNILSPFIRQGSNTTYMGFDNDALALNNVAVPNGTTVVFPCHFGYGRLMEYVLAGAGGLTVTVLLGEAGQPVDTYTLAANASSFKERVLPKTSLMYKITNVSGIASSVTILSTYQLERA